MAAESRKSASAGKGGARRNTSGAEKGFEKKTSGAERGSEKKTSRAEKGSEKKTSRAEKGSKTSGAGKGSGKKTSGGKGSGGGKENVSLAVILICGALLLGAVAYLLILGFRGGLSGTPRRVEDLPYREEVREAGREFSVEEARIYAVIQVESSFRPDAESAAGARGLMQMLPSTYEEVCAEMEIPYDPASLFDPAKNVMACTRYLRQLYDMTGSWRWAHVAYYAGIGSALAWERSGLSPADVPNDKARTYLERIESAYDAYALMFRTYLEAQNGQNGSERSMIINQE